MRVITKATSRVKRNFDCLTRILSESFSTCKVNIAISRWVYTCTTRSNVRKTVLRLPWELPTLNRLRRYVSAGKYGASVSQTSTPANRNALFRRRYWPSSKLDGTNGGEPPIMRQVALPQNPSSLPRNRPAIVNILAQNANECEHMLEHWCEKYFHIVVKKKTKCSLHCVNIFLFVSFAVCVCVCERDKFW